MATFIVQGTVIETIAGNLGIRVANADALKRWWGAHHVDTKLDWFDDGLPVVSINRKAHIAQCKPGDVVELTIFTSDRSNGKRGITTQTMKILAIS